MTGAPGDTRPSPAPSPPGAPPCDWCGEPATHTWVVARWHPTPQAGTGRRLPKELVACDAERCDGHARTAAFIYSVGWDKVRDAPTRRDLSADQGTLF